MNSLQVANSAEHEWLRLILSLIKDGSFSNPRGRPITEIINCHSMIDMAYPVITNRRRKMGYRFLFAEAHWILTGQNQVDTIAPFSKQISLFSDDGRMFQGAYGPKVTEQLRFVCDTLLGDNDTRQAVINIWRENPRPSKDIPCTLSLQFLIREHKLHCIATMRSSDLWLGWVYDVFNFTMISSYVALRLHEMGKEVELGNLHINAGSQHLYDHNREDAVSCLSPQDSDTWSYRPLDIMSFNTPNDLCKHLVALRERQWDIVGSKFMGELKDHVT